MSNVLVLAAVNFCFRIREFPHISDKIMLNRHVKVVRFLNRRIQVKIDTPAETFGQIDLPGERKNRFQTIFIFHA